MNTRERIAAALAQAFAPQSLDVIDESHLHKGHAGHRPEGETHYRVRITAGAFKGKSRVAQHQMVYAALKGNMGGVLHALALTTALPQD